MSDEYGSQLSFTERIRQEQQSNIRRIRERLPQEVHANYNRAAKVMTDHFMKKRLEKIVDKIPLGNKLQEFTQLPQRILYPGIEKEFQNKAQSFKTAFDTQVFSTLVHGTDHELPEETELLSTELYRKEMNGTPTATSDLDEELGNDRYVFANSVALLSPSATPPYYQIEQQDGFVVPMDYADIKMPHEDISTEDLYPLKQYLYARNIFSLHDFKEYFSLYAASFFNTPDEALSFFEHYSLIARNADVWTSLEDRDPRRAKGMLLSDVKTYDALVEMRDLLQKHDLYPPFCPEFQFRDRVKAKKIS